jgi:hypothetical protein
MSIVLAIAIVLASLRAAVDTLESVDALEPNQTRFMLRALFYLAALCGLALLRWKPRRRCRISAEKTAMRK